MTDSRTLACFAALMIGLAGAGCGGGGGSTAPAVINATYFELSGAPNPTTVFDAIAVSFVYSNTLSNVIWHRNSNLLISGHFNEPGYWAHPGNAGGWAATPDNATGAGLFYIFLSCPMTNSVIYVAPTPAGGTFPNTNPILAADLRVATIDRATGALGAGVPAVFSDGYNGPCNLLSSSADSLMILENAGSVRVYRTTDGSPNLTFIGAIALSQPLPAAATGASNRWAGTFAFDGAYLYFATSAATAGGTGYSAYQADGTFVSTQSAAGPGAISGLYFDWSVGRYSAHDGIGARTGGTVFTQTSPSSPDSQVYGPVSPNHTLIDP